MPRNAPSAPPVPGTRACPACGIAEHRLRDGSGDYTWVSCSACGTTRVLEDVSESVLDAYYSQYYDQGNLTVPPIVHQRLGEQLSPFTQHRQTGRLLDVGYGAGTLLEVAEQQGWECWGTELSTSAVEAARHKPWRVLLGDLPGLQLPHEGFDVVCMVEVLEHVLDPQAQLRAALPLLRPGGFLYITTPSASGLSARIMSTAWSAYAPPEHLQLFTPRALVQSVRSAGFRGAALETRGTNPHELITHVRRRQTSPGQRVTQGYALNEQLQSSARGRLVRGAVNGALRLSRLGDSLRLRAQKS